MHLTKDEELLLQGERGDTLRRAMEILVALGDIYGAEQLIEIKSAQIAGVSYKTIGDAGLEWISDLDGKVAVPSILNPAGMDLLRWREMSIDEDFARKQLEIINSVQKARRNDRMHMHTIPAIREHRVQGGSPRLVRVVSCILCKLGHRRHDEPRGRAICAGSCAGREDSSVRIPS
jgi:predicted aconitase subunit 1 (EC 4.2.1.3)